MSFEGHYQIICENHHRRGCDCYDDPNFNGNPYEWDIDGPVWTCDCGATAAWWNLVDDTNGSFCDCPAGMYAAGFVEGNPDQACEYCEGGRIDGFVELEIDQPAETQTCDLGHRHVIKEATYKIPKDKGHRPNDNSTN